MSIPRPMTQDEMISAVNELDQAIYTHEQWTEEVFAALICRLPADDRDVGNEPYRKCRFGQWYYGNGTLRLSDRSGFSEVEIEHKRMHQFAATLLHAAAKDTPISLQDYERFVSALKRMRLEIMTLKHELEVALYNIDALTGVPGRMEMLRKLREQQEFVRRGVHPCAIAMLDIDHFKTVNDTYGHPVGDHVLVDIARYVQSHLRPYDMIFRYGGEEFLLCMPDTEQEGGREICDRLRMELAGTPHRANGGGGADFAVTVSIGVAELGAEIPVEEAVDRADRALLEAKGAGRNRTVTWTPALSVAETAA